jgi:hypothetical protein
MMEHVVKTDYSTIYVAYQEGFAVSLINVLSGIGYFMIPFFLAGLVYAWKTKEAKIRYFICFCVTNLVVSFLVFALTQTPGLQHCLPFAMWVLLVSVFGISYIKNLLKNSFHKRLFLFIIILLFLTSMTYSFLPGWEMNGPMRHLFPSVNKPLHSNYEDQYVALGKKLSQLAHDESATFTVLASSILFNDDVIENFLDPELVHKHFLVRTANVDLRDSIWLNPYLVNYVVISNPPATHLVSNSQQVITIPTKELISGRGIGMAYQRLDDIFKLNDDMQVLVYKKVRGFSVEEVNALFDRFYVSYPDWRRSYSSPIILPYMTSFIESGSNADVVYQWVKESDSIILYANSKKMDSVTISLVWGPNVEKVAVTSIDRSCTKGSKLMIRDQSNKSVDLLIENDRISLIPVKDFNQKRIQMIFNNQGDTQCGIRIYIP